MPDAAATELEEQIGEYKQDVFRANLPDVVVFEWMALSYLIAIQPLRWIITEPIKIMFPLYLIPKF